MALKITRGMFILCCIIMGAIWGQHVSEVHFQDSRILLLIGGSVAGCLVAFLVLWILSLITQQVFEKLFPAVIAIALAMMMGYFASQYIKAFVPVLSQDVESRVYLTTTLVLLFGFAGISLGLTRTSNWEALVSAVKRRTLGYGSPKLVDTSVLIDGRLAHIVECGFIEGTLIIPRFILKELQSVADSSEMLRRAKGRRGLDILRAVQDAKRRVDVAIIEDDPAHINEVDGKIVYLAKEYNAKILTTDFNLNKVAQIEGISVLNINDLANALKPAALPDEQLEVKIVKEGKEAHQGVGYLDDGTMVVVDGGNEHIGQDVGVVVTSVLQTAAGRMIFGKLRPQLTAETSRAS